MLIKKCIVCGKKLIRNQKSFCSRECFFFYQDKRKILKCEFCGKVGKWKRRFCSHLCYGNSRKGKIAVGKQLISLKKGWYSHKKKTEEQRIEMSKNSYWRGRTGDKSANWKNGATSIGRLIRCSNKYKSWRIKVFKRDRFSCCICGKGAHHLEAHHIKSFALILKENNIETIEQANKCNKLWDLDNGQTLCISCHKQTDSYLVNKTNAIY